MEEQKSTSNQTNDQVSYTFKKSVISKTHIFILLGAIVVTGIFLYILNSSHKIKNNDTARKLTQTPTVEKQNEQISQQNTYEKYSLKEDPNLSVSESASIIYYKDGWLWHSDVMNTKAEQIYQLQLPPNHPPHWDIDDSNSYLLTNDLSGKFQTVTISTKEIKSQEFTGNVPIYSPDSSKILYFYYNIPNVKDYGLASIDSNTAAIMKFPSGDYTRQAWSSDNEHYVFVMGKKDGSNVAIVNSKDGSIQTILKSDSLQTKKGQYVYLRWPTWSPDGSTIALFIDIDEPNESHPENEWLGLINVKSGKLVKKQLLKVDPSIPIWSHDGKQILMVHNQNSFHIYNANGDLQEDIDIPVMVYNAYWSPDDKNLLFTDDDDLYLVNLQTKKFKTLITDVRGTDFGSYWSK